MHINITIIAVLSVVSLILTGCTQERITPSLPEPSSISSITPSTKPEVLIKELKIGKADNKFQKPFTIMYPPEWQYSVSEYDSDPKHFFQLEKADHKFSISNLPRGGGACLFGQDPDYDGPHADYRGLEYTENTYSFGTVRSVRKENYANKQRDIIHFCQKNTAGNYSTITTVGDIIFDIPKQSDQSIIREMYRLLESITLNE